MKRTGKIGLLMAALVLLIVASVVAVKTNRENTTETDESESVVILSLEDAEITGLSWTYLGNTLEFDKSEDVWSYGADPEFPLDEAPLNQMLSSISEISATKTIEGPEDLSQYGLSEPACTVKVYGEQEYTLTFGDANSMGGSRYLSLGDGNVYMVDESILDNFSYGLYDLVDKETIPSMDDMISFTVEADTRTLNLEYLENSGLAYSDSYVWFLNEDGEYTALDTELTDDFIYHITNMSWGECIEYNTDQEGLSFYGLDAPTATITVSYLETSQQETNETDEDGNAVYETVETEKHFVLELGDYVDGNCYGRIKDSNMVYLLDGSIADAMRYTTVEELLPDEVILLDEEQLQSVEIALDGESYTINRELREVEVESGDSSAESEVAEEVFYTLDGADVEFADIISDLLSMESTGSTTGQTEAAEEISMVFHMDSESYPEIMLSFCQYNSADCLVSLNGETRLLVARDAMVSLIEAVRDIIMD